MSKRVLVSLLAAAGCAHSGLSGDVRTDITSTMQTAQPTITACYAKELKADRKLRGMVNTSFVVEAKTGNFTQVQVTHDDMNDPQLDQCVTQAIGQLRLKTPQKSNVSVPSYPLDFEPNK